MGEGDQEINVGQDYCSPSGRLARNIPLIPFRAGQRLAIGESSGKSMFFAAQLFVVDAAILLA